MAIQPRKELHNLRDRYERNGYAIVPGVIDSDLLEEVRHHVDWLIAHNPDRRPEKLDQELVADDPFWLHLVRNDRLLNIAEQFIGRNIALFASHYIAKPPRDGHSVIFHQDGSYWPLEPMEVITICLWADDTDPENGCLRVIPGTHRMKLHKMTRRPKVSGVLSMGLNTDLFDESEAVDYVLKAGDVTIHHPHTVHGSNANRSDRWRRGLNIRYIPTSTRITRTPWSCPFLLRGEAVPGINDYLPFPQYEEGRHMPFRGCDAWKGRITDRK